MGCTFSPSFCSDLSLSSCSCQGFFVPLLTPLIPVALPPPLLGSALASGLSILELLALAPWDGGSFWQLLTEGTPAAPLLPKPCHESQVNQGIKSSSVFPRVVTSCRLLMLLNLGCLLCLIFTPKLWQDLAHEK